MSPWPILITIYYIHRNRDVEMVDIDEASIADPLPRPIVTTYVEYISYGRLCLRKVTASKHMIDVLRIRFMKMVLQTWNLSTKLHLR